MSIYLGLLSVVMQGLRGLKVSLGTGGGVETIMVLTLISLK